MVASPSQFTSLKRLLEIRANNYVGAGGVDYSAEEIDALILEKQAKKSGDSVSQLRQEMDRMVHEASTEGPLLPKDDPFDVLIAEVARLSFERELPPRLLTALVKIQYKKLQTFAVPF